jgi:hypothetical protein
VNAPPDVLITREIFPKLPKKKFFGTPVAAALIFTIRTGTRSKSFTSPTVRKADRAQPR